MHLNIYLHFKQNDQYNKYIQIIANFNTKVINPKRKIYNAQNVISDFHINIKIVYNKPIL